MSVYTRCFATISRFAVPYSSCMLWLNPETSTTRKFLYTPKALAIHSLFLTRRQACSRLAIGTYIETFVVKLPDILLHLAN